MARKFGSNAGVSHFLEFGLRVVGSAYVPHMNGYDSFIVWADNRGHFMWKAAWSHFPGAHFFNSLEIMGSQPATTRDIRRRLDQWVVDHQLGSEDPAMENVENLRRQLDMQHLSL